MCGICGFVGPPTEPIDLVAARRMRDALTHRGPDGAGEQAITFGGSRPLAGWLGHRRLKVIDLSDAAHQPMSSDDDMVSLTYNGEIYNFRELRRELVSRGHQFKSSGDTEVILRAYLEWGDGAIARLDGMFALAIWDARMGRLLMARDRTGKKPLYYSMLGGRLTFASEIKSILLAPWVRATPDLARIPEFMTFGYAPCPATMYTGIFQVPPASTLIYERGALCGPRSYWDWTWPSPEHPAPPTSEAPGRVAELMREAVSRRLVSDVPLGALLSGGIDSSITVGLMAGMTSEPVHTFCIGFAEDASFDERSYAQLVAKRFNTRHREFVVRVEAAALLDRILWHHDQPFADSSAIPTYLVCQLAREHVTVVLNGDGGDEVFAGYDRFRAAALGRALHPTAARAGRQLSRLIPTGDGPRNTRRRAERFFEQGGLGVTDRYQRWISVFNPNLLKATLAPSAALDLDPERIEASMQECYRRTGAAPVLDQILYANFKTYLPDDLAVKMDRMSMAHSLETRSPFLDTALIDYVSRIRAVRKIGLRRVKPLLRRAFWPLLPREIWDRKKQGFGVPMGQWFRTELREPYQDEVLAPNAKSAQIFDRSALERAWQEHQSGEQDHGPRLWTILTIERWLRACEAGPSATPPPTSVSA